MNQQFLPQTRAIKGQSVLIILSLIAYVCLIVSFLLNLLPTNVLYKSYGPTSTHTAIKSDTAIPNLTNGNSEELAVEEYMQVIYENPSSDMLPVETITEPHVRVNFSYSSIFCFSKILSFLSGVAPCLLLLLYLWKLYRKNYGKYLLPIIFGLIAISYGYSMASFISSLVKYKCCTLANVLDMILPIAMVILCGVLAFLSYTGHTRKMWPILTAITSVLILVDSCLKTSYLLGHLPFTMHLILGVYMIGTVLFHAALLLYTFFNMIPGNDDSTEDIEPVDDCANTPFSLKRN